MLDERRLCILLCLDITLILLVNLWKAKSTQAIVIASLLMFLYALMLYLEGFLIDDQVIVSTTVSYYLFPSNILLWICTIIQVIRNKKHKKLIKN